MRRFLSFQRTGYSLRTRLFLSFCVLIFVMLLCILPFFYIFNVIDAPKNSISEALANYLVNYEESVAYQFDNIAAYGVQLNKKLTDEIEKTLIKNNISSFKELTNNKALVMELEENTSKILKNSLLISKSSGAFVAFDVTINSSLQTKAKTCSGVYLKISNLNNYNDINPTIFLLRGMPEIAELNDIEIHNMWEMEFDEVECRADVLRINYDTIPHNNRYLFSKPHYIKNTWEKVILLITPIVGKNGELYGVCGLEISSLLFQLTHRSVQPSMNNISGMIAIEDLTDGNSLYFLDSVFFNGSSILEQYKENVYTASSDGEFYDIFTGNNHKLVAKSNSFNPSTIDSESPAAKWNLVAMMPKEAEERLIRQNYVFIFFFLLAFVIIAFFFSYLLVFKFSAPIVDFINKIKEGKESNSNILELNDLIGHIKSKEKELINKQMEYQAQLENDSSNSNSIEDHSLLADITAYQTFIKQLDTLTKSEKKVFELYMQKLNAHEVAQKLCVSINTIRTHNRNIYSKLYVSSYKELMVYIQMMAGLQQDGDK